MSNTQKTIKDTFTPNTLKLLRAILGDDYANTETFQKALEEYTSAKYVIKAGTPKALTDGSHGPCC